MRIGKTFKLGEKLLRISKLQLGLSQRYEKMTTFTDFLSPVNSSRYIAENSENVSINKDGVTKVAQLIFGGVKNSEFGIGKWKEQTLHPKSVHDATIEWIFVVDTLNFCFWSLDDYEKYKVTLDGQTYTGYWSLCAAVNRALMEGIPITDASFYANITEDDVQNIFRGDSSVEIPLIGERLRVLREAGHVLNQKFGGKFSNCVKQSDGTAQGLVEVVFDNFLCYRDVASYKGRQVSFLKRLQILVADIWMAFEGQGRGNFKDIDTLTAFADYRIPQVLTYYGALSYSEQLMETLKKDTVLESGCVEEVEIRGCSLYVIKLVTDELRTLLSTDPNLCNTLCNMTLVDNFIWGHRRKCAKDMDSIPFHKVYSIFY